MVKKRNRRTASIARPVCSSYTECHEKFVAAVRDSEYGVPNQWAVPHFRVYYNAGDLLFHATPEAAAFVVKLAAKFSTEGSLAVADILLRSAASRVDLDNCEHSVYLSDTRRLDEGEITLGQWLGSKGYDVDQLLR